jgi:oxygen-dependent protoporphyrinogen oxidase
MRAAFPRLLDAERSRGSVLRALSAMRTQGAPPSPFMSLPGGIGELTQTLLERLPSNTVRCASAVQTIEGRGPFHIVLESGERIESRALIAAVPAWSAASMLGTVDETLASLCGRVPYVSSATIAFGMKREQVQHPLAGSGFVVPRPERRALMAASWVSSKWPGRAPEGYVLLRGFLGGAYDPDVLSRADDELAQAAFSELASLLKISGDPSLIRVYRWPRASAQHEVGHHERMQQIDQRLVPIPGLFVTGSGFRGTGIPDCVADGRATGAKAAVFLG